MVDDDCAVSIKKRFCIQTHLFSFDKKNAQIFCMIQKNDWRINVMFNARVIGSVVDGREMPGRHPHKLDHINISLMVTYTFENSVQQGTRSTDESQAFWTNESIMYNLPPRSVH